MAAVAADMMLRQLSTRAHITGPHRTLDQDAVFAIDQLVEIAIRALSAAVNDTFTALTCIDWLADGLCTISERTLPDGAHRDRAGYVRLLEPGPSYPRMVNRAYDKIRQSGAGMPAVTIRLLESLGRVLAVHPRRRAARDTAPAGGHDPSSGRGRHRRARGPCRRAPPLHRPQPSGPHLT